MRYGCLLFDMAIGVGGIETLTDSLSGLAWNPIPEYCRAAKTGAWTLIEVLTR